MKFFLRGASDSPVSGSFVKDAGVSLRAVNLSYPTPDGQVDILRDVTVDFFARSTAILGLNGSGKSSLLKLVNGINTVRSGSVQVGGLEVQEHTARVRSHVGLLFSNPLTQLIMPTAVEDVELSLQRTGLSRERRRATALELLSTRGVGHRAEHSIYDLSGGEQQLVALTSVLAVEPEILLLDEPTTLLDLRNKLRLYALLETLPQQLIISTHDLDLAARCERAVVIHNGRVYAEGASRSVIAQYENWCAREFPTQSPLASDQGVA
ncbi:ABC transporter ATP-binding protein [Rothia terrae]|uniref:ABC transporter ATP-binding protein n=1 Tax=Rothia terrae TaxID=396015 RepID=A0A7H2BB87_9MICC|nr:ABC transporter ATP-binding protein [Rothia terrae]